VKWAATDSVFQSKKEKSALGPGNRIGATIFSGRKRKNDSFLTLDSMLVKIRKKRLDARGPRIAAVL